MSATVPSSLDGRLQRLREIEPLTETLRTLVRGTLAGHTDANMTTSATESMASSAEKALDQLAVHSEYAANLERLITRTADGYEQKQVTHAELRQAAQAAHSQQLSVLEQLTHLAQRLPSAEQDALRDLIRISQAAQDQIVQALTIPPTR